MNDLEIKMNDIDKRVGAIEIRVNDVIIDCKNCGMKQACIKETIGLIDSRIANSNNISTLETEKKILVVINSFKDMLAESITKLETKLMESYKEAFEEMKKGYKEAIEDIKLNSKEKIRWGVESVKLFAYFVTFLITLGVISKLP